ncbi:hypothetical protein, partial [Faecalibaculum rodentium]|uniref:hypothetical protein n=1 Tax=Faecalibaculum rodentium TaxID=1702221 RepID=UPI00256F535C
QCKGQDHRRIVFQANLHDYFLQIPISVSKRAEMFHMTVFFQGSSRLFSGIGRMPMMVKSCFSNKKKPPDTNPEDNF